MDSPIALGPFVLRPLELDIPPFGETPFDQLVESYRTAILGEGWDEVLLTEVSNLSAARACALAASELGLPYSVVFRCDNEGRTPSGMDVLAALIVMEGMGAQAFGLCCKGNVEKQLDRLTPYASLPLFRIEGELCIPFHYEASSHDPDVIPCAGGMEARFITPDVDVGETIECSPNLLADILRAEDEPVGALKIAILEPDDLDIFAQHQYAVRDALCLWSDVPELLEGGLRLYQGRAFFDGTGDLPPSFLTEMSRKYGLVVL